MREMEMKKKLSPARTLMLFLYVCFFVIGISGCNPEEEASNLGGLNIDLSADFTITSVTKAQVKSKVGEPSLADFKIEIFDAKGDQLVRSWDSFADMPSVPLFPAGSYLLKASYGTQHKGAFETPYYEGVAPFTIAKHKNTNISVVCRIANVKMTLEYAEGFKKYFKDWSTKVASTGDSLSFSKEETRAAYFEPGRIGMMLTLTKQNGTSFAFAPPAISTEAGKHYKVNLDVTEGGAGGMNLAISFDQSTEENPILINLDSPSMETAPYLTPTGFTSGQPVSFVEGTEYKPGSMYALLTARKGIKSCVISTSSNELQKMGWPASIDLAAAGADLSALTALGFTYTAGDQMAELDFSKLIPRLPSGSSAPVLYILNIEATDKDGQRSQDFSLQLESLMPGFELFQPEDIKAGTNETTLTFELTEGDASKVIPQYLAYGQWYDCEFVEPVAPTGTQNVYTCKVKMATVIDQAQLRLSYNKGSRVSNQVTQKALPLVFEVEIPSENIWSNKVYLTIKSDVSDLDLSKFKVQRQGETGYLTTSVQNNTILVTGLKPGTPQNLVVSIGASNVPISFETEKPTQLDNPDFEDWKEEVSILNVFKGGKIWSGPFKKIDPAKVAVSAQKPVGWSTVNSKTVSISGATKNTWCLVPSTLQSSGQNSTSAVCIRNTAWTDESIDIPDNEWAISGEGKTMPPSRESLHHSVGKVFLGSYTYTNSKEKYEEGIDFTSRPLKIEFDYKYSPTNSDTEAMLRFSILNGDTKLASQTVHLSAQNEWTSYTVTIDYTNQKKVATTLKLMFASSSLASDDQTEEDKAIETTDNTSEKYSVGSALYIDNIKLLYE